MAALHDGCAETIVAAVRQCFLDLKLPLQKSVGFASDGASAMTGRHGGVGALMQKDMPWLLRGHCLDHRLALAAEGPLHDPGWKAELAWLNEIFFPELTELFLYMDFAGRQARLDDVTTRLNLPKIRGVKPAFTRWLSYDAVISKLCSCLACVLIFLEEEAKDPANARAPGLFENMSSFYFINALHMFNDIFKPLANLCLLFQRRDIDFSLVDSHIASLCELLQEMQLVRHLVALRHSDTLCRDPGLTRKGGGHGRAPVRQGL